MSLLELPRGRFRLRRRDRRPGQPGLEAANAAQKPLRQRLLGHADEQGEEPQVVPAVDGAHVQVELRRRGLEPGRLSSGQRGFARRRHEFVLQSGGKCRRE